MPTTAIEHGRLKAYLPDNKLKNQLFREGFRNGEGKIQNRSVKIWTDTERLDKEQFVRTITNRMEETNKSYGTACVIAALVIAYFYDISTGVKAGLGLGALNLVFTLVFCFGFAHPAELMDQEILKIQCVWAQILERKLEAFEEFIGFDPQQTGIEDIEQFKNQFEYNLANNNKVIQDAIIAKHKHYLEHRVPQVNNSSTALVPSGT